LSDRLDQRTQFGVAVRAVGWLVSLVDPHVRRARLPRREDDPDPSVAYRPLNLGPNFVQNVFKDLHVLIKTSTKCHHVFAFVHRGSVAQQSNGSVLKLLVHDVGDFVNSPISKLCPRFTEPGAFFPFCFSRSLSLLAFHDGRGKYEPVDWKLDFPKTTSLPDGLSFV
jgi:hypothetical protein